MKLILVNTLFSYDVKLRVYMKALHENAILEALGITCEHAAKKFLHTRFYC